MQLQPSCQQTTAQWIPADEQAFLATADPTVATIVFVHGNRTDMATSVTRGMHLCRYLVSHSAGRPFRLVLWSWPSDRVPGRHRVDAKAKAARSDIEAAYLAGWLRRVSPNSPTCLVGYSFGCRVITGALHALAKDGRQFPGVLAGCDSGNSAEPMPRMRVVLIAAALDNDWLLPGRPHGLALHQTEAMLITCNSVDLVLKLYQKISGHRGSQALGSAGPARGLDAQGARKIRTVSARNDVGRIHSWDRYIDSAALQRCLGRYAFP